MTSTAMGCSLALRWQSVKLVCGLLVKFSLRDCGQLSAALSKAQGRLAASAHLAHLGSAAPTAALAAPPSLLLWSGELARSFFEDLLLWEAAVCASRPCSGCAALSVQTAHLGSVPANSALGRPLLTNYERGGPCEPPSWGCCCDCDQLLGGSRDADTPLLSVQTASPGTL